MLEDSAVLRKRLGENIRKCRLQRKMTQLELADAAGFGEEHCKQVEYGNKALSMDKFGWKATMLIDNAVIISAGLLMVLGNALGLFPLVLIGMLMAGVCYGGGVTIQASLVRTFYGSKNYAVNFSTCNLVMIPAAFIGPMISAALVDAAGGAFGPTFIMVVVMGFFSLVINFFIRKP